MNVLVVYESKFGNTEKVARAVAETLKKHVTVRFVSVNDPFPRDFHDVNLLVVGSPNHRAGISEPMNAFLAKFQDLNGIWVAVFDTRIKGPQILSRPVSQVLGKDLRKRGGTLIVQPESFFVYEREAYLYDGELNRAVKWTESILTETNVVRA